jgi:hypothetical protein
VPMSTAIPIASRYEAEPPVSPDVASARIETAAEIGRNERINCKLGSEARVRLGQ